MWRTHLLEEYDSKNAEKKKKSRVKRLEEQALIDNSENTGVDK